MFPIAARLGPVTISTFALLVNLGLGLSLAWLYARAPQAERMAWLDLGLAAIAGGLLGARAAYVAANLPYFGAHPLEAVMIWQGGLAWAGAAGGGLLGAVWLARRRGIAWRPWLDALAAPIALLSALAWGGCLAAGCSYGAEAAPGQWPSWLVPATPDLFGVSVPRWPTQAAGLVWGLLALGLVWLNRARPWPAGAHGLYALSLVALGAFALAFLRGDSTPLLAGARLDVISAALVLTAATLGWAALVRRPAA